MPEEEPRKAPPPPPISSQPSPGPSQGDAGPAKGDPYATRPSIFGRMQSEQSGPREIAWREFYHRYVPVIKGFTRNMGVKPQDAEDIVQDVLVGFFGAGSSFVYDPAKGRFRGYLKRATVNAIRGRARRGKLPAVTLDGVDPDQLDSGSDQVKAVEAAWEAEWDRQVMSRAMERVREEYKDNKTFRAFEQYAVQSVPAAQVAEKLAMTVESVYQAKTRVTESLKRAVQQLEAEEP